MPAWTKALMAFVCNAARSCGGQRSVEDVNCLILLPELADFALLAAALGPKRVFLATGTVNEF